MDNYAKSLSDGRIAIYNGSERIASVSLDRNRWTIRYIGVPDSHNVWFTFLGDALRYLNVADLDGSPLDRF